MYSVNIHNSNNPYKYQFPGAFRPLPMHPSISHNANLDNAVVGTRNWGLGFQTDVTGYGLDLNRNGRYDRGSDGVLAFDFNRNGKISDKEIRSSKELLRAFGGNDDINGDGKITICERSKAEKLRKRAARMDHNRDGRLSNDEISRANGRILVDHNRDGRFTETESYSPYSVPNSNGFGRGRIDFVDPRFNYTQVNHGWSWSRPPAFGPEILWF